MPTLRLAWRNLWRNPRRTLITLAAIALNAAILIASYSLLDGLMLHTVANATNLVTGEVEIHAPKYLVNRSMYKSLNNPERILARLQQEGLPAAARSYGYGLLAHGTKSAGAMFWGVDPVREKQVFDLHESTPADERRERVRRILGEVGLAGLEDRYPRQLSGGQQQRVAIARAMAPEPDLILADEPTANVDSQTAKSLLELMRRLNEEKGATFLFSTHDRAVMAQARRLVLLRDGEIINDHGQLSDHQDA